MLETSRQIRVAFKRSWKSFVGIHIAVQIFSVAVLTPLTTLMMGWLVLSSGQKALKDEDILLFAVTPTGSVVLLLVAALYTTVVIFEIAAMIAAGSRMDSGQKVGPTKILHFMLSTIWPLFLLTLQMIGRTVLIAAPFIAVCSLVYFSFLNEFDINYYLVNKPVEFWWAVALITLCLLTMTGFLLRMFSGWFLALPLLLLNGETPFRALQKSRRLTASIRLPITIALLILVVLNLGLFALVSLLVGQGLDGVVALAGNSLKLLVYLLGGVLVVWLLANVAITFLGNSVLCLLILHVFNRLAGVSGDRHPLERASTARPSGVFQLTAFRITTLLVILSLAAGLLINVTMNRFDFEDHSMIIAHRGASAHAPENTLAAMELAITDGADWVEIDVQETMHGDVVVIHDRDLKKIANSDLRVFDRSLAELQSMDIGSWKNPSFSNQRIPTLQQLLAICKNRVSVIIELKYYGQETRLEERVVNIVEAAGMQDQIAVMSLSYAGIQKLKSIRPEWKAGLLSSVAIGDITRLDVDFLAINANFASRSFIKMAHRRGQEVLVWTVNDPISMSAMMSKGVNGIITDYPALASRISIERAQLDTHERMLIQLASLIGHQPTRPTQ